MLEHVTLEHVTLEHVTMEHVTLEHVTLPSAETHITPVLINFCENLNTWKMNCCCIKVKN